MEFQGESSAKKETFPGPSTEKEDNLEAISQCLLRACDYLGIPKMLVGSPAQWIAWRLKQEKMGEQPGPEKPDCRYSTGSAEGIGGVLRSTCPFVFKYKIQGFIIKIEFRKQIWGRRTIWVWKLGTIYTLNHKGKS